MNGNSTRRVRIETGGDGVVNYVGLHALGAFADRLGVGDRLSVAVPASGERLPVHDRGKILTHVTLMLAGGGQACSDIEMLRAEERLFGMVASDTTTWRVFTRELGPGVVDDLRAQFAGVRDEVWARTSATKGSGPVVLDLDGTLVEVHSENKDVTGGHYKGGFGFHPMLCFADATGECLAGRLRAGNAAANNAADHLAVLDDAISQLPARVAAGHHTDDLAEAVERPVLVRTDSAGCTEGFIKGCVARNIGFQVVARSNAAIHVAISATFAEGDADRWQPALRQNGEARPGAQVADLTDLVNRLPDGFPEGTRLIVRREPLHPGAQQSLFPSENFRYWGHWTNQDGTAVDLDLSMRAHAHVEQHIRRLKDSGLDRFPFTDQDANQAWLTIIAMAADLVRWFQLLCLTGPLARAEPKTLRWRLWHAPARIVSHARTEIVRVLDTWPYANAILAAHRRIATLVT